MPHKDPIKRKEYNDIYRRTDKGSESLKAGQRRYREKLTADPIRLEQRRRQGREAMRLRRLHPENTERENARARERYALKPKSGRKRGRPTSLKPKDRKPMKPIDVNADRKKIWVSARRQPLFVENRKTVKRGRPRKKKTERPHCDHDQGFKFKMTSIGMRRTCNACGRSFTEVAKR